jgi:hypothetical protein
MSGFFDVMTPAEATRRINTWARTGVLRLRPSAHARNRQLLRRVSSPDLEYLLETGVVRRLPRASKKFPGDYTYRVEGPVLSEPGRIVKCIVAPVAPAILVIVTVF